MKSVIFFPLLCLSHIVKSQQQKDILRSDHGSFEPLTIPSEDLEKLIFDPEIFEWLSSSVSSSSSSVSTVNSTSSNTEPGGLEEKRELLQDISNRVSDIGLVYIVRDIMSTYFADDDRSRFYEGTFLAAGIAAYGLNKFATAIQKDSAATSSFLQDASDIIGIGTGIASFSLDLQSVVEGSKCIVGWTGNEECEEDRQDVILNTVGSGVSVVADAIGFFLPDLGAYTGVMEILWILSSEAYKSQSDGKEKKKVGEEEEKDKTEMEMEDEINELENEIIKVEEALRLRCPNFKGNFTKDLKCF